MVTLNVEALYNEPVEQGFIGGCPYTVHIHPKIGRMVIVDYPNDPFTNFFKENDKQNIRIDNSGFAEQLRRTLNDIRARSSENSTSGVQHS